MTFEEVQRLRWVSVFYTFLKAGLELFRVLVVWVTQKRVLSYFLI